MNNLLINHSNSDWKVTNQTFKYMHATLKSIIVFELLFSTHSTIAPLVTTLLYVLSVLIRLFDTNSSFSSVSSAKVGVDFDSAVVTATDASTLLVSGVAAATSTPVASTRKSAAISRMICAP